VSIKRYSHWCAVIHEHDLSLNAEGQWVRYTDHCAALEAAKATTPGWIRVTDRLPPYNWHVLAWNGGVRPIIVFRYSTDEEGEHWRTIINGIETFQVTHWRELPEPPKQ